VTSVVAEQVSAKISTVREAVFDKTVGQSASANQTAIECKPTKELSFVWIERVLLLNCNSYVLAVTSNAVL